MWAGLYPEAMAIGFDPADGTDPIIFNYRDLNDRVSALAVRLESLIAPGDRILLPFENGIGFVIAYMAGQRAGAICVPAPLRGEFARLLAIIEDCSPALMLCDPHGAATIGGFKQSKLSEIPLYVIEDIDPDHTELALTSNIGSTSSAVDTSVSKPSRPLPSPDAITMLQYTSGTTSTPKGVCLTQRNILENARNISRSFGINRESRFVSWLPLFHDMGLFGGLLQPLLCGGSTILLPRSVILRNPLRWLEAISKYRANTSGAPDFAYAACVQAMSSRGRELQLDLSTWRVAWNGAEPVRSLSLVAFARTFARFGFRAESFLPAYGMAEATLIATAAKYSEPPVQFRFERDADQRMVPVARGRVGGQNFVSVGLPPTGTLIAIIDPRNGNRLSDGFIGEICVHGPQVARQYWRSDIPVVELDSPTGDCRSFLRTGDLGFLHEGQLYVSGRLKDVIIRQGRNIYPEDIEVEATKMRPEVQLGYVAAFAEQDKEGTVDGRIILVIGVPGSVKPAVYTVLEAGIRDGVYRSIGVVLDQLVLIPRGQVARTSSGKVQRAEIRRKLNSGELTVYYRSGGPEASVAMPSIIGDHRLQFLQALIDEKHRIFGPGNGIVTEPDLEQPLFRQGFDSLDLLQIAGLVEEQLGEPPPDTLLNEAPARAFVDWLLQHGAKKGARKTSQSVAMPQVEPIPNQIPLTREQKALFFADYGDWRAVLLMPLALPGRDDAAGDLALIMDSLISRYPSLSLRVSLEQVGPVFQMPEEIPSGRDLVHTLPDAGLLGPDCNTSGLGFSEVHLWRAAAAPLNPEVGPGLRLILSPQRSAGEPIIAVLAVHHLLADGRSLDILARDVAALWEGEVLPPRVDAAFSLLETEEAAISGPDYSSALADLKDMLAHVQSDAVPPWPRPLEVPLATDDALPALRFALSRSLSEAVVARAAELEVGIPAVLLAAWRTALVRFGVPPDAAVNVMHALSRSLRPDVGPSYGARPAPIPLATHGGLMGLDGDEPALQIAEVQRYLNRARSAEAVPFPMLVQALCGQRGEKYAPFMRYQFGLITTALSVQPDMPSALACQGRTGATQTFLLPQIDHVAQVNLQLMEHADQITAMLCYDPTQIYRATAIGLRDAFLAALTWLIQPPNVTRTQNTTTNPPWIDPIIKKVAAYRHGLAMPRVVVPISASACQAAVVDPLAPAVIEINGTTSREMLWCMVDRIAERLGTERGVVAVLLPRGVLAVAAHLAVLRTGCICLPIDVDAPSERVREMLRDAKPRLLLTNESRSHGLPVATMYVSDVADSILPSGPLELPLIHPEDPAYLIYTSGSTGTPKGVVFNHGSLAARIAGLVDAMRIQEGDRVLHYISPGFDPSIQEILMAISAGAAVVVVPQNGPFDPGSVAETIATRAVTHMVGLPSTLRAIARHPRYRDCRDLRAITCGGEPLESSLRDAIVDGKTVRLLNVYGATETTICATIQDVTDLPNANVPSVGAPMPGTSVAVITEDGALCARGVVGQIAVGGETLAAGYLNRPDLTASKFLIRQLTDPSSTRWYLTGDLGWIDDYGDLWTTGRMDRQVKISGQRIEPEEIAERLRRVPGIDQAYVRAVTGTVGTVLVAYLVTKGRCPPVSDLRNHLGRSLSPALIPRDFVFLAELPLTTNGKINEAGLPKNADGSSSQGAAPTEQMVEARDGPYSYDSLEARVAGYWCAALRINEVRPEDNFFDLGGHSLLALDLVLQIERELGRHIPANAIFQAQTVPELASLIRFGTTLNRIEPSVQDDASNALHLYPGLTFYNGQAVINPLVVVSPGIIADTALDRLIKSLPSQRPVLLVTSRFWDSTTDLTILAHRLEAKLTAIYGVVPVHFVGYSIGAWTALYLARLRLDAEKPVSSLALLDPPDRLEILFGLPLFKLLKRLPPLRKLFLSFMAGQRLVALSDDASVYRQLLHALRSGSRRRGASQSVGSRDFAESLVSIAVTSGRCAWRLSFWRRQIDNLVATKLDGTHSTIVDDKHSQATVAWLEDVMERGEWRGSPSTARDLPGKSDAR